MEKLVRDLIPAIIEKSGRTPVHYIASDEDYRGLIKNKLVEEVQEFLEAESIEELADVLEVIDAIYKAYQFDKAEVASAKKEKKEKRGGFEEKIVLVRIETPQVTA